MTGIILGRWIAQRQVRPRAGWLAGCLAALLTTSSFVHAQMPMYYGSGVYPPAYPQQAYQQSAPSPYGYYPPPAQPTPKVYYGKYPNMPAPAAPQQALQPAQNRYYGNYQNNTVPGYIYPRNYQAPAVSYNGGNGVTYYYVQNPNGLPAYPYNLPPANGRPQAQAPSWPAPVTTPPAAPPYTPIPNDDLDDGRKPVVQFHRATNDSCWVSADYIAAFIRPMRFQSGPLVTLGAPGDIAPGALGQPGTSVVFGNQQADFNVFSGFRLAVGTFLNHDNRFSIDAAGFVLFPNHQNFSIAADPSGNPTIARPIFNTQSGLQGAFLNSLPNQISGNILVENKAEMLGAEINARWHGYVRERLHIDGLVGFRYLRLAEGMQITEHINPVSSNFLSYLGSFVGPPNSLSDYDSFQTVNQFFGPQIGGRVSWEHDWATATAFFKLGIGANTQQTSIQGSTTLMNPNAGASVSTGGILAQSSNIGNHDRTVFGIVPEFGCNLGIDLTSCLRLNLGYSFLMWNAVVRPGSQYDHNVNPGPVPGNPQFGVQGGPVSPVYRFNDEFFWLHTFNFGLEYHY